MTDSDTLPALLADYDACARETEQAVAGIADLSQPVPVPKDAPWFPKDGRVSIRWMLLHLVQEIGRHAGHADIIRESLDGKNSFELIDLEREG